MLNQPPYSTIFFNYTYRLQKKKKQHAKTCQTIEIIEKQKDVSRETAPTTNKQTKAET